MRTIRQVWIGLFSVVFLLGGMTIVTPWGSEAEAKKPNHKSLAKDHDHLGHWIESLEGDHEMLKEWLDKIEEKLDHLSTGGGGGEGNHTLRWDRILDSTNGVDDVGREGCDSSRFKCIFGDTAVVDLETGLVWERSPDILGGQADDGQQSWLSAINHCTPREVGGRKGWSLPTVEQLASLVDTSGVILKLPTGHPFLNIALANSIYWTATTSAVTPSGANFVQFNMGVVNSANKTDSNFVWCVRGGQTFDGNTHITLH